MRLRRPSMNVAMISSKETRMEAASTNQPRSRLKNAIQMTAWIIRAFAIWIAEILVSNNGAT
jgi:hypothetical protein